MYFYALNDPSALDLVPSGVSRPLNDFTYPFIEYQLGTPMPLP